MSLTGPPTPSGPDSFFGHSGFAPVRTGNPLAGRGEEAINGGETRTGDFSKSVDLILFGRRLVLFTEGTWKKTACASLTHSGDVLS